MNYYYLTTRSLFDDGTLLTSVLLLTYTNKVNNTEYDHL